MRKINKYEILLVAGIDNFASKLVGVEELDAVLKRWVQSVPEDSETIEEALQ